LHSKRIDDTLELLANEYSIDVESINNDYSRLINAVKAAIRINDNHTISELSKKIPLFQTIKRLIALRMISDSNKKIYIPFFNDFRGRKYDTSTLTLTFYKELRYVVHRGHYTHNSDYLNHNFTPLIDQTLKNQIHLIDG
jgi:hypothetical protein